jgi:hypothetical protein
MGMHTDPDAASPAPRLYDLGADLGEQTNVAAQHPEIVAKLQALATKMAGEIAGATPAARRPAGVVADPKFLYPVKQQPNAANKRAKRQAK